MPDTQQTATVVWVDGSLRDPSEATVTALDHGLTVGDGVFETLKVVDGVPFALTRHLQRLARSAAGLGLELGPSELTSVRAGIDAVIAEAKRGGTRGTGGNQRLRITRTAGPGPLGSDRLPGRATLVVALAAGTPWPEGASVAVAPWPRNERGPLVGLKTTSYAENVVALHWAHARGADEALFANTTGELCEGTGSNVFVVLDDRVLTPRLQSGCLAGITRDLVLEWTAATEAEIALQHLVQASEVFLTSSTRDVQAVTSLDGLPRPVGPHTRAIREEFARRSAADVDP